MVFVVRALVGIVVFVVRVLVGIRGNIARLGDATDRKAVGLIVVVLRVRIITVDVQVAGVGARVRSSRPPEPVRTLIDGSSGAPGHGA